MDSVGDFFQARDQATQIRVDAARIAFVGH